MANTLESLLQHPSLWRASGQSGAPRLAVPSGYPEVDARLPGGGWPFPALIELLVPEAGTGELSLLTPLLRSLSRTEPGQRPRVLALLNPPFIPYAPALEERGIDPERLVVTSPLARMETLWAMEQALRSGACAAVLGWAEQAGMQTLRRLKLAANEGQCLGVLFRSDRCRTQVSPAHVRAVLGIEGNDLLIDLIKVQGGRTSTLRVAARRLDAPHL
jgi:hypothetical protein